MPDRPPLPGGPYLVVGLARSGVAALRALREAGTEAVGVDAGDPEVDLPGVHLGTDGLALLDAARAVVKSPGVPAEAPVIAAARERGMPVLGELELGWRMLDGRDFIAITGTNGKTTTTELVGHVHRAAGMPVAVAGNVGTPVTALDDLDPRAVVVCEASSFQLEDAVAFAPEAAVLLNIEPDHLDRHGTFAAYREAKLRVFAHQGKGDVAVLPAGTDLPATDARRLGPADIEGWELSLRGAHNRANASFAAAVCLARGIAEEAVREGLRTFPGVEHRLEEVAERDGVLYVNDSKSTNVAATLVALAAFAPAPVHLIAGGQGKGQDFSALRAVAAGCAGVYLIGEDGRSVAEGLWCETLERAVAAARAAARAGDVILLSPACASFDQFTDYEARGHAFKELAG